MKPPIGSLVWVKPQKLWSAALAGCLLVPLVFLAFLRQSSQPLSILNLQVSVVHSNQPALLDGVDAGSGPLLRTSDGDGAVLVTNKNVSQSGEVVETPTQAAAEEESGRGDGRTALPFQRSSSSQQSTENHPTPPVDDANVSSTVDVVEKPSQAAATEEVSSVDGLSASRPTTTLPIQGTNSSEHSTDEQPTPPHDETRSSPPSSRGGDGPSSSSEDQNSSNKPAKTGAQESKIICDLSQIRTDFCDLFGDVRINGSSSSVLLATPSTPGTGNETWSIRPYARKWETALMPHIKEFSVRAASAEDRDTPRCTVNHSVPAVIFSTGGLQGNIFHEMADVLVPLFLTTFHYHGEVQFLITQYRSWWVDKYQPILRQLSNHEVMDADADGRVHCFAKATVGLLSHVELGIDPSKPPVGYSMTDFRRFLRTCYSLKREYPQGRDANQKPRLLYLSRRGSRSLMNERQVLRLVRNVGFKVVIAKPETTRNLTQFARTVNSCDVLLGVHGAGLTNMLFLPTNGTVMQVIPWGELKYACRFSYGDPAVGMGMRYLEYEVGKAESSLIRQYPKDHPVLTDPMSVHRRGFPAVWSTFIDKQNVTVDVGRFRPVLLEALEPFRPL